MKVMLKDGWMVAESGNRMNRQKIGKSGDVLQGVEAMSDILSSPFTKCLKGGR